MKKKDFLIFRRPKKGPVRFLAPTARLFALVVALLLPFGFLACQSLKKAAPPLGIFDAEIAAKDFVGVEFVAVNLSGRPVQSAFFLARLSEKGDGLEEGDAFSFEAGLEVPLGLEPGGEERLFVPFEELDCGLDGDDFEIESLFLERAVFEGGEEWTAQGGETM